MPHATGFYQRGYNQVEKFFYSATGIVQGIMSGKTSRDLQDYYIRGPKVKFQKPGYNLEKWEKFYQNRYNPYKRKVKGDVVIETDNKHPEALRTDESLSGRYSGTRFQRFSRRSSNTKRRRRRRSCRRLCGKGYFHRTMASRFFKRRKFYRNSR